MSTALKDVVTTTTIGIKKPLLQRWPEGGATAQVVLTGGTAVVELRGSVLPGEWEPLVRFQLPVPVGEDGAGNLGDSAAVHSFWSQFDWNVVNIDGGGTLKCGVAGLGLG